MSLLEQQNFLAQVYTDEKLRREFLAAPEKIGEQNNLSESEISEMLEIFPDEINAFAASLTWKRLHEVEKILPLTKQVLGTDFTALFREFAPTFNSTSVKRHLEDALNFAEFLQSQDIFEATKDISKYELSRLLFHSGLKNFIVAKFNLDVREFFNQTSNVVSKETFTRKRTLAIWLRIGKIEKHFIK